MPRTAFRRVHRAEVRMPVPLPRPHPLRLDGDARTPSACRTRLAVPVAAVARVPPHRARRRPRRRRASIATPPPGAAATTAAPRRSPTRPQAAPDAADRLAQRPGRGDACARRSRSVSEQDDAATGDGRRRLGDPADRPLELPRHARRPARRGRLARALEADRAASRARRLDPPRHGGEGARARPHRRPPGPRADGRAGGRTRSTSTRARSGTRPTRRDGSRS